MLHPFRIFARPATLSCFAWLCLLCVWPLAGARAGQGRGSWLPLFHIALSNNVNSVHYALAVDSECRPVGKEPVKVYWRMRSKGPNATEGLTMLERLRAYGIETQTRVDGGVDFRIVARPKRLARARVGKHEGRCQAKLWAQVNDQDAAVQRAWVKVVERKWWQLPEVAYVDIFAITRDGRHIKERIVP